MHDGNGFFTTNLLSQMIKLLKFIQGPPDHEMLVSGELAPAFLMLSAALARVEGSTPADFMLSAGDAYQRAVREEIMEVSE